MFSSATWESYRGRYESLPEQRQLLGVALAGSDGVELFRRAKGILAMMRRYCHIAEETGVIRNYTLAALRQELGAHLRWSSGHSLLFGLDRGQTG